jgi:hypothetical protein
VGRTFCPGRLEDVERLVQGSFIFVEPVAREWHSTNGPLWYRSAPGRADGSPGYAETEVDQVVIEDLPMRYLLLNSAVLLAGLLTVASAETPSVKRTVYLDSVVLEDIKTSNPERYAQIQHVMASASEMCKPNAARSWSLANAPSADCSAMVLKTSYPPKRQISFAIGNTRYIANVIVRDAPALVKAEPGALIPLGDNPK